MEQVIFPESQKAELIQQIDARLKAGFDRMDALAPLARNVENRMKIMRIAYDLGSELFRIVQSHLAGVEIRCHKGCSYCCDQRVEILPIESLNIARHLQSLGESDLAAWTSRLVAHKEYAEGKPHAGYQKTCPFLGEGGACQIYDVRPYQCRLFHSLDETLCKVKRQNIKINLIDQLDQLIVRKIASLFAPDGLSLLPSELGQGVLAALENPDAADEWLGGGNPFPRLPEYSG